MDVGDGVHTGIAHEAASSSASRGSATTVEEGHSKFQPQGVEATRHLWGLELAPSFLMFLRVDDNWGAHLQRRPSARGSASSSSNAILPFTELGARSCSRQAALTICILGPAPRN